MRRLRNVLVVALAAGALFASAGPVQAGPIGTILRWLCSHGCQECCDIQDEGDSNGQW